MKLIISFSAREDGNCDQIAKYIALEDDKIILLREKNIHPCMKCKYECFEDKCIYWNDDIYGIYDEMCNYDKVIFLVPMYCGNPSSLYFIFNERCQDYFMHNENYEDIVKRLYIIGVYGNKEKTPDFEPCFEKWFECLGSSEHVLGIERHAYNQKMGDCILEVEEVREKIRKFVEC
ncbi:MAG: flavodoxin family protein [Lachnospiraceae bacterium]|nr:flavodoxin family protein [Lachnospiraceae bacterium]